MIVQFMLILSLHNPGTLANQNILYKEGIYTSVDQCWEEGKKLEKEGFFGDKVVSFECQNTKFYNWDVE